MMESSNPKSLFGDYTKMLTQFKLPGVDVAVVWGPLAGYFKLEPLPLAYFPWLAAILLGYAVLTTVMKRHYIRRYGWQ